MLVDPRLREQREVWEKKPVLQKIYADYHRRMLAALPAGEPILEVGGGSGNLAEQALDVVSIDLMASPWIDVACDAHQLPFADGSFGGIAMLDVLHHLASPTTFFDEAFRVLRPGGRMALIEPGITPLSWLFYHFLHQEPVDMSVDPLADQPEAVKADPFQSNQAVPTLLFARARYRAQFAIRFPDLKIIDRHWLSFLAYPLSGGFKRWSLLPSCAAQPLLNLEEFARPLLGPLSAFRLAIVLEKL